MQSHRWQPSRLPCPWDSPGKNTGVGCHFLLQCMKVKSESEVAQSCPTLRDPMDCSLPGSSVHGSFQARVLEWGAIAFSGSLTLSFRKHSAPGTPLSLETERQVRELPFQYWAPRCQGNHSCPAQLCDLHAIGLRTQGACYVTVRRRKIREPCET